MSNTALAWAMKQPVTPLGTKCVLIILADKANEQGECWPSLTELRKVTSLSDRQIRRHVDLLAAEGYVETEQRGRASNLYRLNLTGHPLPVEGTPDRSSMTESDGHKRPVVEIADRSSMSPDSEPSTGHLRHFDRSSMSAPTLLTQKNPKNSPSADAPTRAREGPAWLKDLYRLGWADGNRLDERETQRIVKDYGALDLCSEVEKFVSYWQSKPKPSGNWNTYRRLRTWLDRAKNGWNGDRRRDNRTGFGRITPPEPGELSITRRHTG